MGIGFEFCEVSAMQSRNIDKPFKVLANIFYSKFEEKVASLMSAWLIYCSARIIKTLEISFCELADWYRLVQDLTEMKTLISREKEKQFLPNQA